MKRLSPRQKLQRTKSLKRRATKWKIRKFILFGKIKRIPKNLRGTIRFECPKTLSLERNFDETIAFFQKLKELSLFVVNRRKLRRTSPIYYSIGLGGLTEVSVRCAVIFAAEMDRLRRIAGHDLFYQGRIENDSEPVSLLRQLGVFRLVGKDILIGIDRDNDEAPYNSSPHGHRISIRLMSGRNCDERRFIEFEERVRGVLADFETTEELHSSMAEAMLNAINHAYLSEFPLKYPSSGKRWWAAAVYDTLRSELKVLVFDQGHGIAKTLPSSGLLEHIELMAAKLLGRYVPYVDTPEEVLVKAALESARTRTGEVKRGKGFKDIQAPVHEISGARLRIASGRAEVTLANGCDTVSQPFGHHIGGTLIEWAFPALSLVSQTTEAT